MTADSTSRPGSEGRGTLMHKLSLASAATTLIFAAVALFLGMHLASLQADQLQAQRQSASSEAAAVQAMQSSLKTAQAALDAERKQSEQLRAQVAGAMKELKAVKADLAKANQTIDTLQSTPAADRPLPAGEPPSTDKPSSAIDGSAPEAVPQAAPAPIVENPPAAEKTASGAPATDVPPVGAAGKSHASPAVAQETGITEEALTDSPQITPKTRPAGE